MPRFLGYPGGKEVSARMDKRTPGGLLGQVGAAQKGCLYLTSLELSQLWPMASLQLAPVSL